MNMANKLQVHDYFNSDRNTFHVNINLSTTLHILHIDVINIILLLNHRSSVDNERYHKYWA